MFEGSGGGIPNKLDWRVALPILLLAIPVLLAVMADQAVFVHPPNNFLERFLAIVPALLFPLIDDRLTTGIVTGIIFLGATTVIGLVGWVIIERHVLEPMHIKKMVATGQREEKLFNRYRGERKE